MRAFRILLVTLFVEVTAFTWTAFDRQGLDFLSPFLADLIEGRWPGQFNADFVTYLLLTSLWVGWRHRFSGRGLLLMPLAVIGGTGFIAPYLLYLSYRHRGDVRAMLTGDAR